MCTSSDVTLCGHCHSSVSPPRPSTSIPNCVSTSPPCPSTSIHDGVPMSPCHVHARWRVHVTLPRPSMSIHDGVPTSPCHMHPRRRVRASQWKGNVLLLSRPPLLPTPGLEAPGWHWAEAPGTLPHGPAGQHVPRHNEGPSHVVPRRRSGALAAQGAAPAGRRGLSSRPLRGAAKVSKAAVSGGPPSQPCTEVM